MTQDAVEKLLAEAEQQRNGAMLKEWAGDLQRLAATALIVDTVPKLLTLARSLLEEVRVLREGLEKPYVCERCEFRASEKWGRACPDSDECCLWAMDAQSALAAADRIREGK